MEEGYFQVVSQVIYKLFTDELTAMCMSSQLENAKLKMNDFDM